MNFDLNNTKPPCGSNWRTALKSCMFLFGTDRPWDSAPRGFLKFIEFVMEHFSRTGYYWQFGG